MTVFWVEAPYSLVEVYRRFRGAWNVCKLLPVYTAPTTQKTAVLIPAAVRTSNPTKIYLLHRNMFIHVFQKSSAQLRQAAKLINNGRIARMKQGPERRTYL
jgi:hypothetical protein